MRRTLLLLGLLSSTAVACEKVSLTDSEVLSRERLKTVVCRNADEARDFLSGKRGRERLDPRWREQTGLTCKLYALDAEQKYRDRFKKPTGCATGLEDLAFTA